MLGNDKTTVASKARPGMGPGFLSPPAPRGSAGRASLSTAYGSIPWLPFGPACIAGPIFFAPTPSRLVACATSAPGRRA